MHNSFKKFNKYLRNKVVKVAPSEVQKDDHHKYCENDLASITLRRRRWSVKERDMTLQFISKNSRSLPLRFSYTMAVCVAVIGKDNSPLYIGGTGNDTSTDNELSRQWLVHTALDALEERLTTTNNTNVNSSTNTSRTELRDLYLGLLYSTDTHKIYGYVTNTRIKLVLVTSSTSPSGSNIRDAEVRTALRRLHALYADAICNPFHLPGDQITSQKFDKQVKSLIINNV